MSSVAPPPNPCLVAIILIVQSRAGPRFVYHYPPNPLTETQSRRSSWYDDLNGGSDSSSSDDSSLDSEDDTLTIGGSSGGHGRRSGRSVNTAGDRDMESMMSSSHSMGQTMKTTRTMEEDDDVNSEEDEAKRDGNNRASWERVLGFGTESLEKLLSPSRSWHKRRFEVGVGELAFVGWPCFVREDGTWQKAKKRKKKTKVRKKQDKANGASLDDSTVREGNGAGDGEDIDDGYDDGADETDDEPTLADSKDSLPDKQETMTMFNVVFVLNPPELEYSMRIKEMYEHVVKKLSRALKWEQARVDYVWKEAQTILSIKEKAKENGSSLSNLYSDLLSHSSLARAIASIHASVSSSKIASVSLTPSVSISLQIPPLTSISVLPSATESPLPGVWLTTADSVSTEDTNGAPTTGHMLAKHFSLLLLDNETTILKDVEASSEPLTAALAHYIRSSKPTKSFAQISAMSSIPLQDIQLLASHLVYWRRARAIPPIHQRDTYIVSPNCDLRKLATASVLYANTFPALPSLPKMLSALSGAPRPYYTLIPSKDHKETYFNILAWLLRGGWVTQLRTFGWIKVSKAIKEKVEIEIRREKERAKGEEGEKYEGDDQDEEEARRGFARERASFSSLNPKSSTNPLDAHRRTSISSSIASTSPTRYRNERFSTNHRSARKPTPAPMTSAIILNPHRASDIESRWLDAIQASLSSPLPNPNFPENINEPQNPDFKLVPPTPAAVGDDSAKRELDRQAAAELIASSVPLDINNPDVKRFFPKFQKYLNGHDALEKIPVREGLKRKYVWRILTQLGAVPAAPVGSTNMTSMSNLPGSAPVSGGQLGGHSSSQHLGSRNTAAADDNDKVVIAVRHW